MKYLLIILLSINLSADIIDKSQVIVRDAIKSQQYKKLYKAVEVLYTSKNKSLDVLFNIVKIELAIMNMYSIDMHMDYIAVCDTLKKINKKRSIEFPKALSKITNSKKLEKNICNIVDTFNGQELLDNGLFVLARNGETYNSYNIKHAMRYFKASEKKNPDKYELYSVYLEIYRRKEYRDWSKIYKYSKKILAMKNIEDTDKAEIQRYYAISRFNLTSNANLTKSRIRSIIKDFKKAQRYGDKKSISYIKDLNSLLVSSNNNRKYCDYLSNNRDMYMCKGGKYCDYLSNNRDMYMCKRGKYCDYLSNNRDMYMCKGGKYCDYLSNNRDMYMCKGGKYCDYLSNNRDINMCKGMRRW